MCFSLDRRNANASSSQAPFPTPPTPDHFRAHVAGPQRSQARQGRLEARGAAAPGAEFRWSGKRYFLTYAQVSIHYVLLRYHHD